MLTGGKLLISEESVTRFGDNSKSHVRCTDFDQILLKQVKG